MNNVPTTAVEVVASAATLIGSVATAYESLTPQAAAGLRAVFAGETAGIVGAHRVAALIVETTPLDELKLVLTRLIMCASDTEADVMVHGAPNGFEGVRNHG